MKNKLILIIGLITCLSSCEKVIEIDLNEANPAIVIEANVHNNSDSCLVRITKTGSYFKAYSAEMVSGADIVLENEFFRYRYNEIEDGIYKLAKIGKLALGEYVLKVTVGGESYEAASEMPSPVKIEYLVSEYEEGSLFEDGGYRVNFGFKDPEFENNYYRIRYYINDSLQNSENDYFLIDDDVFNGNSLEMAIYGERFDENDTVKVELMSIDKNTYEYFNTFQNIIGDDRMDTAAPANPNSNFNNGALGYFSAYSSDFKTIVVKNGQVSD